MSFTVAHTCNLSSSEGRDQEDGDLKPARGNSLQVPISKKPITKKGLVEWVKVLASVKHKQTHTLSKLRMRAGGMGGSSNKSISNKCEAPSSNHSATTKFSFSGTEAQRQKEICRYQSWIC
jgi:hypothetical protein